MTYLIASNMTPITCWAASTIVKSHSPMEKWIAALFAAGMLAGSSPGSCGEIHDAAKGGDLEKVKLLVQAKPNLVFRKDHQGQTPLLLAVKFRHRDVAAFLLASKADVNTRAKDESFTGDGVSGVEIGGTCLTWAVQADDKVMVELLLTNEADVNLKDGVGTTPLHLAAQEGHKAMAELLLAHGAEVDPKDEERRTPLHQAAQNGHTEMAALLLAKGADVNAKDKDGNTPLHLTDTIQLNQAMLELLLAKGAKINDRDKHGNTPLLLAAQYCVGDTSVARFLIANGADVNAKNKKGYTPLTIPKQYSCPELLELLRLHGGHN